MALVRVLGLRALVSALMLVCALLAAGAQTTPAAAPPRSPRVLWVRIDAAEWAREDLLDRLNFFGAPKGLQFSLTDDGYAYQILYDIGQKKVDTSAFVLGPGCKTVELTGKNDPCQSGAPVADVSVFDPKGELLYEAQHPWGGVDAVAKDLLTQVEAWGDRAIPPPPETPLKLVAVSAARVNCVFHPACNASAEESTADTALAAGAAGVLHTRTRRGRMGAPAAGLYAYEYRLELQGAPGAALPSCIAALTLDFGSVIATLDYRGDGARGNQVFVVSDGAAGGVGLASATRRGGTITFRFASPLCAAGQSTVLFGLASENPPATAATIGLADSQGKVLAISGRVPRR